MPEQYKSRLETDRILKPWYLKKSEGKRLEDSKVMPGESPAICGASLSTFFISGEDLITKDLMETAKTFNIRK